MKKEDIDILSKLLSDMKDSLNDLDSALKKKDYTRINNAKRRLLDLQMQINRKI